MKIRKVPLAFTTALGIAIGAGAWAYAASGTNSSPPIPPQKQQLLQAQASRQAEARAHAPSKPSVPPPLPEVSQSNSWVLGIRHTGQEGQLAGLAETSEWHGVVHGTDVAVLAGSADTNKNGEPNSVGKIVVQRMAITPTAPNGTFTPYADAAIPGPYTIASASGNVLTLSDGNGNAFTFNADNDEFGK
jgi:hypothetical protein